MAKTPRRPAPLHLTGPQIILRVEMDDREDHPQDVTLSVFNEDGVHPVVISMAEQRRLRRWLDAVEKARS